MKFKHKLLMYFILIVAGAGALFYYGQGLQNTSLENIKINEIKNINSNSFTMTGDFYLKNPSELPVPIENIKYDIILKETNEKISSGVINSFILEKQKTTKVPFTQEVRWVPTANLATKLITKDKVYAIVKGKIKINLPQIQEFEIPFEKEVDIKEYVSQFSNDINPIPLPEDDNKNDNLLDNLV